MRLTKLKIAGFKSFVDPTTVTFPSSLTGVVGPNGCGKSNIIDSVRWVMGEISAKHLRGESMADVIFNGSSARKPLGSASVELVFDNSEGKIGGAYATYNEVALRRSVSRDGTSDYFINGIKVRRKDITQLFLGTGLGSRSYAIIEQGMISRIIEARPDDLRAFLEEAAGISRYKERRRETESRIAETRENLDRLNDLREEVEKQIRHLQRQAATARRYQVLKEEERKLQAEVFALRLQGLDAEAGVRDAATERCETAMQAAIADLREAESEIERIRVDQSAKADALGAIQERFYAAGSERLAHRAEHPARARAAAAPARRFGAGTGSGAGAHRRGRARPESARVARRRARHHDSQPGRRARRGGFGGGCARALRARARNLADCLRRACPGGRSGPARDAGRARAHRAARKPAASAPAPAREAGVRTFRPRTIAAGDLARGSCGTGGARG